METIKDQLKAAIIDYVKSKGWPIVAVELAAMPTSVFDAALQPVAKRCQTILEDCEMALSDEWDRTDDGFEAMKDSMEELLNLLDVKVPTTTEKTEDAYEEYLNEKFTDFTFKALFERYEYLTNKNRQESISKDLLRGYIDSGQVGKMLRQFDPIAFQVGFNEWNP